MWAPSQPTQLFLGFASLILLFLLFSISSPAAAASFFIPSASSSVTDSYALSLSPSSASASQAETLHRFQPWAAERRRRIERFKLLYHLKILSLVSLFSPVTNNSAVWWVGLKVILGLYRFHWLFLPSSPLSSTSSHLQLQFLPLLHLLCNWPPEVEEVIVLIEVCEAFDFSGRTTWTVVTLIFDCLLPSWRRFLFKQAKRFNPEVGGQDWEAHNWGNG